MMSQYLLKAVVVIAVVGHMHVPCAVSGEIDHLQESLRQRANRLRNFDLTVEKQETRFKWQEGKASESDQIRSAHEVVSQDGMFREHYRIESSIANGVHVNCQTAICPLGEKGGWSRADVGRNGSSDNMIVMQRSEKFDPTGRGAMDASIGEWGTSTFEKQPVAIWQKEEFSKYGQVMRLSGGAIQVRIRPTPESDECVLEIRPDQDYLVTRVEKRRPDGGLLSLSEVESVAKKDGVVIPQQIRCKQYRYHGQEQYLASDRLLNLSVASLTPSYPASDFRVVVPGRGYVDRVMGMRVTGWELTHNEVNESQFTKKNAGAVERTKIGSERVRASGVDKKEARDSVVLAGSEPSVEAKPSVIVGRDLEARSLGTRSLGSRVIPIGGTLGVVIIVSAVICVLWHRRQA